MAIILQHIKSLSASQQVIFKKTQRVKSVGNNAIKTETVSQAVYLKEEIILAKILLSSEFSIYL